MKASNLASQINALLAAKGLHSSCCCVNQDGEYVSDNDTVGYVECLNAFEFGAACGCVGGLGVGFDAIADWTPDFPFCVRIEF